MKTSVLTFLALLFPLAAVAQYFNPIIPDNVADPSVSKFGDTYYLYGTTDIDKGLDQMGPPVVWKSKDLVNWSFEGTILPEIEWNTPYLYTDKNGTKKYGYYRYWAPGRAVEKDNLYYLFPTIVSPDGTCPVYTLVSESPEGPFRFQNGDGLFWGDAAEGKRISQPLLPDIDGEPFTDDDGKTYMYWRHRKAAQVSADFSAIESETLTLPTRKKAYSEGPTMFKRNGIYYYVYTQGGDQNYRNAYMISRKGPLEGFEDPAGNDVFISSSLENGVWGPGHGNVFYDEDSDTYVFFYLEFGEGSTTRQVFADKMGFNADGTIRTIVPGFEGVGYLNNAPDKRINLAPQAKITASSAKETRVSTEKVYTDFSGPDPDETSAIVSTRSFTYEAQNAIDGSNGTRWMASGDDKRPYLTLDFGEIKALNSCEMAFTFPAFGHAWILEKSLDGKSWEVCGMQSEAVARSPHIANGLGEARFLRLKIVKGDPGLWEIKVYAQSDPVWGNWTAWGDQGDGSYVNPVLPADFSDIDCIRVGDDYYAISSTFQFSPGMTILHSTDLVNWEICGHAIDDLTQISPALNWTGMNRYARGVWAGTIRYHNERFYVFFGTPDEGYFMTSASDPAGPWEPLHPLLAEPGWDDCSVLWDEEGNACFVGTHFADKYKTYLFRMSPDGKTIDRSSAILVNSGAGREANKLIRVGDWYYLIFSEHYPDKGRYVMAKRSKNLMGPYEEEKQLAHTSRQAMEPNQGGIIQAHDGNWYFFTHHGTGNWEGRCVSLLPVTWIDGWPIIGEVGADGIGNMVWKGKIPGRQNKGNTPITTDSFDQPRLSTSWQWNYQPRAEMYSLTERPGWLRLKAFKPLEEDRLLQAGNTLTRRSFRSAHNEVTTKFDISAMADGQKSGLCHFSKTYASIGVVQANGIRRMEYRQDDTIVPGEIITTSHIWLRSVWGLDGKSQFSYSLDGETFIDFGDIYTLKWGNYRGDRIGIYTYNNQRESGVLDVDFFNYPIIR